LGHFLAAADTSAPPTFQKTKERRSLRGRVAALVRQGVGALASGNADLASSSQGPKTFGISLDQCYMSNNYEVSEANHSTQSLLHVR